MANGILRAPLDVTHTVFLYGTLLDPELFEIVAGCPLNGHQALLPEAATLRDDESGLPILASSKNETVSGMVIRVDDDTKGRLDFYQTGIGCQTETQLAECNDDSVSVLVFILDRPAHSSNEPWSLAHWQNSEGVLSRRTAREFMALSSSLQPNDAARTMPQIRMRVASTMRAEREPTPAALSPDLSGRLQAATKSARPYTDYFSVQEDWLSFPTFQGGQSAEVKRASFVGGDAVTVLPYDPNLDAVMMVRQFRHGPFARGDTNPWTLEPAAGRIDPGETPEACARRELVEETGVTAISLHQIGRYYPTPGAFTEFLYSYVALADLGGRDGGVAGLETEDENIMAHVVPLSEATAMIQSGAVNTGPLLISLWWLELNKKHLKV